MASRAKGKLICSLTNVCFCHLSGFPEKEEHRVRAYVFPLPLLPLHPLSP